jgi:ribonuclease HI
MSPTRPTNNAPPAASIMPTLAELRSAAYKTERIASRRLARTSGLPEREALIQTLQRDGRPLAQLLTLRAQAQADAIAATAARQRQKADALAQKRARRQADPSAWQAWFDGSAHPNPGRLGLGGLIRDPAGALFELCAAGGHGDSNEAEYLALIAVLETAVRLRAAPLVVCGDSRVVIDSLGSASHAGVLSAYHARARALLAQLPQVTLRWIPRRRNAAADALSQRALAPQSAAAAKGVTIAAAADGESVSL